MDITLTVIDKQDYLFIESTGVLTGKEDLFEHANLIYTEILRHHHRKVLMDGLHTRFPSQMFPYIELVEHYGTNFPPGIKSLKLACVLDPAYKELAGFWETVAVNRGFRFYAFTSMAEALKWILG